MDAAEGGGDSTGVGGRSTRRVGGTCLLRTPRPPVPRRRPQCPHPSNGTGAGRASPRRGAGVGTPRLGARIRGAAEPSGRPRGPKPSSATAARRGRDAGGEMGTPRGKGVGAHSPRGAPHVRPPVRQSAGPSRVESREPRAPAVRGAGRGGGAEGRPQAARGPLPCLRLRGGVSPRAGEGAEPAPLAASRAVRTDAQRRPPSASAAEPRAPHPSSTPRAPPSLNSVPDPALLPSA